MSRHCRSRMGTGMEEEEDRCVEGTRGYSLPEIGILFEPPLKVLEPRCERTERNERL